MHETEQQSARKSTTVRMSAALGALGRLAPSWAAREAARQFFTPRGRRRGTEPRVLGCVPHAFRVASGGEVLEAWSYGRGPTALLVHGWSGHAGQLAALASAVLERGWRAVAFDLPAHGASTGETTSLPEIANAIRAVASVVGGVQAVVAHSLGGAAATLALTEGLRVERAVLLAPSGDPMPYVQKVAGVFGLRGRGAAQLVERIEERAGRRLAEVQLPNLVGVLRATPALVLHDPADAEVPAAHGRAIAEAWPGARFVEVAGAGHRGILKQPFALRAVQEFLGGPGAQRAA